MKEFLGAQKNICFNRGTDAQDVKKQTAPNFVELKLKVKS